MPDLNRHFGAWRQRNAKARDPLRRLEPALNEFRPSELAIWSPYMTYKFYCTVRSNLALGETILLRAWPQATRNTVGRDDGRKTRSAEQCRFRRLS